MLHVNRSSRWPLLIALLLLFPLTSSAQGPAKPSPKKYARDEQPWYLKPVQRPAIPAGAQLFANPIDAFIAAEHQAKGLKVAGPADRRTLHRRVYLDLIGMPPSPAEQDAFLRDSSTDAYEKVVDRLLASEQHGVRYGRHWLDVLRYADVDEAMIAAPGIHLWREWVMRALNSDVPYDQFVCAQLTGYRTPARMEVSPLGFQEPIEPRPEDIFALGFLARGADGNGNRENQELPIAAVETVSTAFLGLTVGCAKCHDHMYDPISQRDFYAMKALFDPLVLRKVSLGNAAEMAKHGRALDALERKIASVSDGIVTIIAPYKKKLLDERIAQLPAEVRAVILKPATQRTLAEEKIADDYFPILRIDVSKIKVLMPQDVRAKYLAMVDEYKQLDTERRSSALPIFWTVEVDRKKELEKTYILTSGDPARPEKQNEVAPGWPFAPKQIDWRRGRTVAFAEWLTAPENPLFARVAVNRLWQWHFGEPLLKTPSDFGKLGGLPSNAALLDWLAAEFVARKFSMKAMHRLIVTSQTYRLATSPSPTLIAANAKVDPGNRHLWRYPLRRLDAETVWDSIFAAAGNLDLALGGPSFEPDRGDLRKQPAKEAGQKQRRGAYMMRGYASNREVMPAFLQAFDADDGRAPCPMRTHTVTAPQALFLMNSDVIDQAATRFAERLHKTGDLPTAVELAYRTALGRPPTPAESSRALAYLGGDPNRLRGLAWLMFNLDEFVFVP